MKVWHYAWPVFLLLVPGLLLSGQDFFSDPALLLDPSREAILGFLAVLLIHALVSWATSGRYYRRMVERRPIGGSLALAMIHVGAIGVYLVAYELYEGSQLGGFLWLIGWVPYWLFVGWVAGLVTFFFTRKGGFERL